MKCWEYRVLTLGGTLSGPKDQDMESELNALGQDGWEAVAMRAHENSNKVSIVLKRPLPGTEPKRSNNWTAW